MESAIQAFSGSVSIDHLSITGVSAIVNGSAAIDSLTDDLTFADGTVTSPTDGLVDRGKGWMKVYRSSVTANVSVANRSTTSVSVTDSTLAGLAPDTGTGFEASGTGGSALLRTTITGRNVAVRAARGPLTVTTSTIGSNMYGIGAEWGPVAVVDSTLVNNPYGSLYTSGGGTITITNSIVSSNGAALCKAGSLVTSLGWNLASNTSCGFTQTGDVQGVATLLGLLANNGGYTSTYLPSAASPAVGTGKPGCSGKDQRGVVRPTGGSCDKGAVER